jgi:hypothetical protein
MPIPGYLSEVPIVTSDSGLARPVVARGSSFYATKAEAPFFSKLQTGARRFWKISNDKIDAVRKESVTEQTELNRFRWPVRIEAWPTIRPDCCKNKIAATYSSTATTHVGITFMMCTLAGLSVPRLSLWYVFCSDFHAMNSHWATTH